MKMQQVLFIWWWNAYPSREAFQEELKKRDYNPFEVKKNGHCLVKEFKCKFYPEYKDFGSMGDL